MCGLSDLKYKITSFKMSASSRVRIEFDKTLFLSDNAGTSSWMLIDCNEYPTVENVQQHIKKRYLLNSCGPMVVRLYLQNAWLPPWERTSIIRENDLISVQVFSAEEGSSPSQYTMPVGAHLDSSRQASKPKEKCKRKHHSLDEEESLVRQHKHKKRKSSEESHCTFRQLEQKDCHLEADKVPLSSAIELLCGQSNASTGKKKKKHTRPGEEEKVVESESNGIKLDEKGVKNGEECQNECLIDSSPLLTNTSNAVSEIVVSHPNGALEDCVIDYDLMKTDKPKRRRNRRRKRAQSVEVDLQTPNESMTFQPALPTNVRPLRNVKKPEGKRVVFDSDEETIEGVGGGTEHSVDISLDHVPTFTGVGSQLNEVQGIKETKRRPKRGCTVFYEQPKMDQLNAVQTNKSIIFQNLNGDCDELPDNEVQQPCKDYTTFPPLTGPPRVGDVIAFKVIELSSMYTPEVSEYREAKVIQYTDHTKMVDVDISTPQQVKYPVGKFDLVLEDGAEILTNVDQSQSTMASYHWPSLLEPRLIS